MHIRSYEDCSMLIITYDLMQLRAALKIGLQIVLWRIGIKIVPLKFGLKIILLKFILLKC